MIIESDIFQHPKFIRLKTQAGDIALEILGRLWAHCQANKRGQWWPGATRDYIEVICSGGNSRKTYFDALKDSGWITIHEDGVEIHDWNEHNASLVARWKRDQHPTHKPAHQARQTSAQPLRSGCAESVQTPAPVRDMTGHDMTGREGMAAALPPPPPGPPGPDPEPDSAVGGFGEVNCPPSKTEVLRYAEKTGIPPPVALNFFDHYASTNWWSGSTRITDFRPRLDKWNRNESAEVGVRSAESGPTTTAGRIGLEKAAGLLRERIASDPANPDSASGIANPTDTQKKDYRAAKTKLREIENQLTNV